MSDEKKDDATPKKKGGMMKMLIIGVAALALGGGGAAAGVMFGGNLMGAGAAHADDHGPKLVPKADQKRVDAKGGGDGGGHGGGDGDSHAPDGELKTAPAPGHGGEKYASNYFTMDKEFTSNLKDSVHFMQVGIAVSTPYDDTVLDNLKTHEIAVRSAILMTLNETGEDQVFTAEGKKQLQQRLVKAINDVLIKKEGFGGISNVYFTTFIVQ